MTLAQWEIPCDSVKSIITQTFRKHENKVTHDYIPLNYAEAILQKKWLTLRNEEMESYMVIHVDSFQHSLVKAMYSPPPPPPQKKVHPHTQRKQKNNKSPGHHHSRHSRHPWSKTLGMLRRVKGSVAPFQTWIVAGRESLSLQPTWVKQLSTNECSEL